MKTWKLKLFSTLSAVGIIGSTFAMSTRDASAVTWHLVAGSETSPAVYAQYLAPCAHVISISHWSNTEQRWYIWYSDPAAYFYNNLQYMSAYEGYWVVCS